MNKLKDFLIGTFGLAVIFPVAVLMLFSLPLSVIALMRFFALEWWVALICLGIAFFIPLVNILVFLLPFAGAYYLFVADGSFQEAAYPVKKVEILDFNSLSDDDFSKFKRTILIPQTAKQCKSEAAKNGFEGKITSQNDFCDCLANKLAQNIRKEDFIKNKKNPSYTPFGESQLIQMRQECL